MLSNDWHPGLEFWVSTVVIDQITTKSLKSWLCLPFLQSLSGILRLATCEVCEDSFIAKVKILECVFKNSGNLRVTSYSSKVSYQCVQFSVVQYAHSNFK